MECVQNSTQLYIRDIWGKERLKREITKGRAAGTLVQVNRYREPRDTKNTALKISGNLLGCLVSAQKAIFLKWSVTKGISIELLSWSSVDQMLMQMNSMGAKVLMLSNGAHAAGFGHLSQYHTYSFTSLSMLGQKRCCLARWRIMA